MLLEKKASEKSLAANVLKKSKKKYLAEKEFVNTNQLNCKNIQSHHLKETAKTGYDSGTNLRWKLIKSCRDQQIQLPDRTNLGKPREKMALPHAEEEYNEANEILRETHEKDIKVRKPLFKILKTEAKLHLPASHQKFKNFTTSFCKQHEL